MRKQDPHRIRLIAGMIFLVIIYGAVVVLCELLFSDDRAGAALKVFIPSMIVQFAAFPYITPDGDHFRIRVVLMLNQAEATAAVSRLLGRTFPPIGANLEFAERVIRRRLIVQRDLPPALLWFLDMVFLFGGAWLGSEFGEAWKPPAGLTGFPLLATYLIIPLLVAVAPWLAARSAQRGRDQLEGLIRQEVSDSGVQAALAKLPLHDRDFREKLERDVSEAAALTSTSPAESRAIGYYLEVQRASRLWTPVAQEDLSFTVWQFGAGLLLGALFQAVQVV